MNLSSLQDTITAWVEAASTLEVEWGRLPQKAHDGAFVLAYAGPLSKLGHDERIQTYDGVGPDSTSVRVVGVRRFPLRLSFRSFDQRLGGSARQYAEEFRSLAHTEDSFALLSNAELALVDTSDLIELDYTWSGRTVSQVELTVDLALRASFSDPLHDGSYIGSVNYTGDFDEDGDGSFDDYSITEEITE